MARKSKSKKLETLTEQIARLQLEANELQEEMFLDVGKYVSEKVGSNDFETIKDKIDTLFEYDLKHTQKDEYKNEDEVPYTTSNANQS